MPSQRNIIIAGSVAIVIMIIGTYLLYSSMVSEVRNGFETEDLQAPAISYDQDTIITMPSPLIANDTKTGRDLVMHWTLTPVYSSYGGVIDLSIENQGTNLLYCYGFGVSWPVYSISTYRDANVTIQPGETAEVGLLLFGAPSNITNAEYKVNIKLAAQNYDESGWYDYGLLTGTGMMTELEPEMGFVNYSANFNTAFYFDKVNGLVDFSVVSSVLDEVNGTHNSYDIQQVIAAFDWVRENIEYLNDTEDDWPDTDDHWQSPQQTLTLGTGDCEDHAILMASIVGALGGNARVNFIEGHAFATVYVGNSSWSILGIRTAISSHYGCDLIPYFIKDGTGYWMTLDTTGFPYAGGLVTFSAPVINGNSAWTFVNTDWMECVDAVGDQ